MSPPGSRDPGAGRWLDLARRATGFMPDEEGLALHRAALDAGRSGLGPLVEVGAYCGRSTLYLASAARSAGTVLYSVDHHRGSEENQAGWEHHDPTLVDARTGRMDTLGRWRATVEATGLEEWVVGVVGRSATVSAHWRTPLCFLLIDGGHGTEPAWADYRGWAPWVAKGGLLAMHDVFTDPADGGRPPYEIWLEAVASGRFAEAGSCGSLRLLRRIG
ncbi:MAG: class I SAM-dependent methyltransferase [Acidimicrobiales bacterium]